MPTATNEDLLRAMAVKQLTNLHVEHAKDSVLGLPIPMSELVPEMLEQLAKDNFNIDPETLSNPEAIKLTLAGVSFAVDMLYNLLQKAVLFMAEGDIDDEQFQEAMEQFMHVITMKSLLERYVNENT